MLHCYTYLYTTLTHTHTYICASWKETSEQAGKNKEERMLLVVSRTKKDKRRLDGNIQRLLSIQQEGGKSLKEGLDSQVLRGQERPQTLRTNPCLPSCLIHGMSERALKILWSLLATVRAVQTIFVSFVVTLSSYPTGSDTHKALVDRAKSPDAFWHHRIRVLHHLWNKNNEPLRFCFIVKRRQYKRGNLHRCHNRENKWHRLYLAQDSLCLFFSCHKPEVHRGSCQLQQREEALLWARTPRCQASSQQNRRVVPISMCSQIAVQCCLPSPATSTASTQTTPQPPHYIQPAHP